jgi:hypothetical protein
LPVVSVAGWDVDVEGHRGFSLGQRWAFSLWGAGAWVCFELVTWGDTMCASVTVVVLSFSLAVGVFSGIWWCGLLDVS